VFLVTPRLLLRPPWPEDAAAMVAAFSHWDVVRQTALIPWPYALADAQAFIAGAALGGAAFDLVITRKGDGQLVGGIGIKPPYGPGRGHPDLGYWIAPEAAGRGYATEAGRAVVAFAFGALRLPVLDAGHYFDNPASARVLVKLGFTSTGRRVQWPSRARGGPVESVEYSLSRDDWLAQRDRLAQAAP
jgi:RimJ/RimL family protein N-acetyltransferase